MALRAHNAYEGDAEMPNGKRISVQFMDRAGIVREFGRQPPVGHPNYPHRRRVGWYWQHDDGTTVTTCGPFTSSRRAMMDALARNPAPTESDHV